MSNNWTYLSKLRFSKKLPQFCPWGNSVRIMGIHTTRPAVKNHISSEMARELIAIFQLCTMCASWFISEFFFNYTCTYFSIIFITGFRIWMSTDTQKIQYQKEEEVRVKRVGETGCMNPQRPKNKIKNEEREEVQKGKSNELPDLGETQSK